MKRLHMRKLRPMLAGRERFPEVVQDEKADQRGLDIAARADPREGIRQGLEEARSGKGRRFASSLLGSGRRTGLRPFASE